MAAKKGMYSITVTQRVDGRWAWTIETRDVETNPLYADPSSSWRWASNSVGGTEKTAEKAMLRASELLGTHVAMDIRGELKRTFASTSPVATASL